MLDRFKQAFQTFGNLGRACAEHGVYACSAGEQVFTCLTITGSTSFVKLTYREHAQDVLCLCLVNRSLFMSVVRKAKDFLFF